MGRWLYSLCLLIFCAVLYVPGMAYSVSLTLDNGDQYHGEIRYGKPDGQGVLIYKDIKRASANSYENRCCPLLIIYDIICLFNYKKDLRRYYSGWQRYEGEFKDGVPEGKGILYFVDDLILYGQFEDGMPNGEGILYDFKEHVGLIGNFDDGLLDGEGRILYDYDYGSNRYGDMFEGDFDDGVPDDGYGVYTFKDGRVYKGDCVNGKPQGRGKVFLHDKLVYDGEMYRGRYKGYGKKYQDGILVYDGYFDADLYFGNGTHYDGNYTLSGNFAGGKLYGRGKIVVLIPLNRAGGYTISGNFYQGFLSGNYTIAYNNGDVLRGFMIFDTDNFRYLPNAKGTLRKRNGESYTGAFENGVFHGKGVLLYSNRDRYEGHFKNGLPHGRGTLRSRYRGVQTGWFIKGQFNAEKTASEAARPDKKRCGRFRFNSNGTVLDTLCGLMWTCDANIGRIEITRDQAFELVRNLRTGGFSDWDIPTKGDLMSLQASVPEIKKSNTVKWLKKRGFFNVNMDMKAHIQLTTIDLIVRAKNPQLFNYLDRKNFLWAVRSIQ